MTTVTEPSALGTALWPLTELLGELPELLAADGVDLHGLAFHNRAETEYDANWKICIENYLECYHCSVAHPSFSKAIDVAPDAYSLETRPSLLSQFGPPRNGRGARTVPRAHRLRGRARGP